MRLRLMPTVVFCLAIGLMTVSAQPGSFITLRNTNLFFPASELLTNGLAGLTNPPAKLMVSVVQTNSTQGGIISLVGTQAWVKRFNGPINNEDQAYSVVVDGDGNIIVAGYSQGAGTSADFITLKYTVNGTPLWMQRYDSPTHGTDRVELAAVDGSNNVYVCGESANASGANDIVTIKYSASGTPVWTNRYIGTPAGFILLADMAVDTAGNVYVLPSDADSMSYITVKYDVSGNAAWTQFFNHRDGSEDSATRVAVDKDGNVFVTGNTFHSATGGGVATIKYANDGTLLWTNRTDFESNAGILVDHQSNVIVTLNTDSVSPQIKHVVIKYSNGGTPLWTNIFPAPNYLGGGVPALVVDAADNLFLTAGTIGSTGSTADFTIFKLSSGGVPQWTNRFVTPSSVGGFLDGTGVDNAGNHYFACSSTPISGNADYATFKCFADGRPAWTNFYNGPANFSDNPRSLATDAAGNVYVAGTSSGSGSVFSSLDFATVKYADRIRYTPPLNFVGIDTFAFVGVDHFGNTATGLVTVAVLPLTLQFSTVSTNLLLNSQGIHLRVDGARSANPVVIEASTNLVTWLPLSTNPPVLGSVSVVDTTATNRLRRFYRAYQKQ
jgi:Beta-propeller repeat